MYLKSTIWILAPKYAHLRLHPWIWLFYEIFKSDYIFRKIIIFRGVGGDALCQNNWKFLIFTYFFNIDLFFCYSLIFLLFTYTWVAKVKWISEKWIAKKNCYSLLINIHLFLLFTYTWFGTKCIRVPNSIFR